MFSMTTMASSMTMPTDRVKASIVMAFSVNPMYQISPKVDTMEVGMAMAAMAVDRAFHRKSATTSAARMEPRIRCSFTVRIEALMYSDWSRTMRMS